MRTLRDFGRTLASAVILVGAIFGAAVLTSRAQFDAVQTYVPAAQVGGSANAITLNLGPNVISMSQLVGVPVRFVVGTTNAAGTTTINPNSIGAVNVLRPTPGGLAAMGGGEMLGAYIADVMWDGTQFQLRNSAIPDPPGKVIDYAGAAGCPVGYLEATGAAFNTSTYAALNTVLSSTWTAGTLPDLRGRATFSRDISASARITSAGGNFDGTVVGGTGGQQNRTLAQANLPNVNQALNGSHQFGSDVSNIVSYNGATFNGTIVVPTAGGTVVVPAATNGNFTQINVPTTVDFTQGSVRINGNVTQTVTPVLSNSAIVIKCVRG